MISATLFPANLFLFNREQFFAHTNHFTFVFYAPFPVTSPYLQEEYY